MRVHGVLIDVLGEPLPNAIIQIVSTFNTDETLIGGAAHIKTEHDGSYDFELRHGAYDVYAQVSKCSDVDLIGHGVVKPDMPDGSINELLGTSPVIYPELVEVVIDLKEQTEQARDETLVAADDASNKHGEVVELASDVSTRHQDTVAKHSEVITAHEHIHDDKRVVAEIRAEVEADKDAVVSHSNNVTALAQQVSNDKKATETFKNAAVDAKDDSVEARNKSKQYADDSLRYSLDSLGHSGDSQNAENAAVAARDIALIAANRAEIAAASLSGALIELGDADLSTGVAPEPLIDANGEKRSCFWKVVAGGTVFDVDYGIGDSIVYSVSKNAYYKIDNTESVTSVNGKQGVVVVTSESINAVSRSGDHIQGDLAIDGLLSIPTESLIIAGVTVFGANSQNVRVGDKESLRELHLSALHGRVKVNGTHLIFHQGNLPTINDVVGALSVDFGRVD